MLDRGERRQCDGQNKMTGGSQMNEKGVENLAESLKGYKEKIVPT
jgi:hypothetical protein